MIEPIIMIKILDTLQYFDTFENSRRNLVRTGKILLIQSSIFDNFTKHFHNYTQNVGNTLQDFDGTMVHFDSVGQVLIVPENIFLVPDKNFMRPWNILLITYKIRYYHVRF